MLGSLRKNTSGWFLKGLLVLCALAMAMFGVDQLGRTRSGAGAPAAWVNGEVITTYEFQDELGRRLQYYRQMMGDQYNERLLMQLRIPEQTLDSLVQQRLLGQQAERMNIIVPDIELARFIHSLPQLQKNGKFDKAAYSKLQNRGYLEKRERQRLQVTKLQSYIENRITLTPEEIKRNFLLQNTKVSVRYAKINFSDLVKNYKPSKKEIQAVIDGGNEAEFKAAYEKSKAEFTLPAKVRLRQIRVGIPFQAKEQARNDAKKKITEAASGLTVDNFAEYAKKHSDDEFAKKGGARGWVERRTLEPELEKAIAKLTPGVISPPIETTFGYFLVLLEDTTPEVIKPLDQVKPELAKTIARENHKKSFETNTRNSLDTKLAAGKAVDADLRRLKVEIKTTKPFSLASGFIPEIGQSDEIVEAIFGLSKQAPLAKKLHLHRDSYYYLKLATLEKAKSAELEKGADNIERSMKVALRNEVMQTWIRDLEKKSNIKKELDLTGG